MASRRDVYAAWAAHAICATAVVAALGAAPTQAQSPSATATISQVQVALLVGGALGGGTPSFGGERHDFSIGGLGASRLEASAEVHDLQRLDDF